MSVDQGITALRSLLGNDTTPSGDNAVPTQDFGIYSLTTDGLAYEWDKGETTDSRTVFGVQFATPPVGGGTTYYKMTGMDAVTTARDSWKVSGTPDFAGASYAGGLATPLRNIHIGASWTV